MVEKVLKERGSRYGSAKDNAQVTQQLMEILLTAPSGHRLTRMHKESLHMICHKMARMVCGDHMYVDNATDMAGYSKLLEEFLIEESKNNAKS